MVQWIHSLHENKRLKYPYRAEILGAGLKIRVSGVPHPLQAGVLDLELAHALGLVNPQAAVRLASPKIRLVRDPERLTSLTDRLALGRSAHPLHGACG